MTEEVTKNIGQGSRSPSQDLNLGPPKYERVRTIQRRRSVHGYKETTRGRKEGRLSRSRRENADECMKIIRIYKALIVSETSQRIQTL
jgi:hypothetical protein